MEEIMMITFRWFLLAGFAFAGGFLVVQYMVRPVNQMGLYAFLLTLALAGLIFLLIMNFKGHEIAYASLLLMGGLVGGYIAANAAFLAQEEKRKLPDLVRKDGGDGHTAILYFTHGEPPGYSAQPWIETIRELDHDNVPFVPWLFRPFFFNTVRAEYFEAGGSAHNKLHKAFFDNLRRSMPEEEARGAKFYLAFLDSNPRPDEMTIRAINDGASKIIILPVFITESTHTVAGQQMVANINPEAFGVQVCYTGALWDSEPLQTSIVERADELTGETDKSKVGVLLVGHGQPTEWEQIYPEQNKQESLYRDAIREKLIADGYQPDHVVLGWMEFQEPSITKSIVELSGRGVEKILVLAVSLSADSIHSDVEVPAAVSKANLPAEIEVEYVGQYGDHPLAIQAMIEKIAKCR
jgi:sirohydrochlorin ferrochelatase